MAVFKGNPPRTSWQERPSLRWHYHSVVTQGRQQLWLSCLQQSLGCVCLLVLDQSMKGAAAAASSVSRKVLPECANLGNISMRGLQVKSHTGGFDIILQQAKTSVSITLLHLFSLSLQRMLVLLLDNIKLWGWSDPMRILDENSWLLLSHLSVRAWPSKTSEPGWRCQITTWDGATWSTTTKQDLILGFCSWALLNVELRPWCTFEVPHSHSSRPWAAIKWRAEA